MQMKKIYLISSTILLYSFHISSLQQVKAVGARGTSVADIAHLRQQLEHVHQEFKTAFDKALLICRTTHPDLQDQKIACLEKVHNFLRRGVDVNLKFDGDRTLLSVVSNYGGCVELIKILLSMPGIKVNCTDRLGNTPLIHAVGVSDADAVRVLLVAALGTMRKLVVLLIFSIISVHVFGQSFNNISQIPWNL